MKGGKVKKKKKKPEVAGVAGDGKATEESGEPQGEAGLSQDDSLDSLGASFYWSVLLHEAAA